MATETAQPLDVLSNALALAAQLAIVLPELQANAAAIRAALASNDDASLSAQIDQLHGQSQQLTAEIAALRS